MRLYVITHTVIIEQAEKKIVSLIRAKNRSKANEIYCSDKRIGPLEKLHLRRIKLNKKSPSNYIGSYTYSNVQSNSKVWKAAHGLSQSVPKSELPLEKEPIAKEPRHRIKIGDKVTVWYGCTGVSQLRQIPLKGLRGTVHKVDGNSILVEINFHIEGRDEKEILEFLPEELNPVR